MSAGDIYESNGVFTSNEKGWECPKCGKVFSPSVTECPYCGGCEMVEKWTPPYRYTYTPYRYDCTDTPACALNYVQ